MLHSSRSMFLALASATLLLAAQAAPIHAAPDPDAAAIAYGQLWVFILDVAAGHDGQPLNPSGEQAFRQWFAEQLVRAYPDLDADSQQAVADLPRTRDQLAQLWPWLTAAKRRAIAQHWAASVEPIFADMPCELYVAFEGAELVPSGPYEQANTAHLFARWDATQPSTTGGGATGVASPDPGTSQASNDFFLPGGQSGQFSGMLNFQAHLHGH